MRVLVAIHGQATRAALDERTEDFNSLCRLIGKLEYEIYGSAMFSEVAA